VAGQREAGSMRRLFVSLPGRIICHTRCNLQSVTCGGLRGVFRHSRHRSDTLGVPPGSFKGTLAPRLALSLSLRLSDGSRSQYNSHVVPDLRLRSYTTSSIRPSYHKLLVNTLHCLHCLLAAQTLVRVLFHKKTCAHHSLGF
jgi:hypothetical protein